MIPFIDFVNSHLWCNYTYVNPKRYRYLLKNVSKRVEIMSPLTEVRKVWKLVNDVFHLAEVISHDDVIFGTELDLSLN